MGKDSGGGQPQYVQSAPATTTQINNSKPWAAQIPYLKSLFSQAGELQKTPLEFYGGDVAGVPTGQTYAPFSPETQAAMGMTVNTALNDQLSPAATKFNTGMLSGDYLSAGNPYFSEMVKNISNTVTPQIESQFSKAGRYGSGAMDNALASSITDTAGNLAYQNYGNVLGEMGKSLLVAPQTAAAAYTPAQQIAGVGAGKEDQTQNAINQAMQQWQFSQMEPWQRLGMFDSEIQGNYGGTSTSTGTAPSGTWYQPTQSGSNVGSLLSGLGGLGMLAYSMFSDKRTKENIKPLKDSATDLILKMEPVSFDYKPEYGGKNQLGFVADDLEKVAPELVFRNDDDMRMVAPFGLLPILVKAVQEQHKEIEELRGNV